MLVAKAPTATEGLPPFSGFAYLLICSHILEASCGCSYLLRPTLCVWRALIVLETHKGSRLMPRLLKQFWHAQNGRRRVWCWGAT